MLKLYLAKLSQRLNEQSSPHEVTESTLPRYYPCVPSTAGFKYSPGRLKSSRIRNPPLAVVKAGVGQESPVRGQLEDLGALHLG